MRRGSAADSGLQLVRWAHFSNTAGERETPAVSTTRQPLSPSSRFHPPPLSGRGRGGRWVKIAVRVTAPVLAVGTLLVIKPEIISGTLETTAATLRVGVLLLGWLTFAFLVRRFVRPPVLRSGVIAVVGLALLAVTVRPYFIDTRANDTLLTGPASPSTPAIPDALESTPAIPGPSESTLGPTDASASPPSTPDVPEGEASQSVAATVSSGQLKGLAGHRGSGAASIVRARNGSHVVQLEDYNVSSGVTLFLYVVPGANRQEPGANGVNLDRLAENTGNRVVPIPEGIDVSGPQTVLIWCKPFATPIAAANQTPA